MREHTAKHYQHARRASLEVSSSRCAEADSGMHSHMPLLPIFGVEHRCPPPKITLLLLPLRLKTPVIGTSGEQSEGSFESSSGGIVVGSQAKVPFPCVRRASARDPPGIDSGFVEERSLGWVEGRQRTYLT